MEDKKQKDRKFSSIQEELGVYLDCLYVHKYYKFTDQDNVITFYHTYKMKDAPWYGGVDFNMAGLKKCNECKKGEK